MVLSPVNHFVIAEDIPQFRNKSIDFEKFDLNILIAGFISTIVPLVLERSKKYYRDKNTVQEIEFKIFNVDKTSFTCLAFSLSMIVFALYDIPIELTHAYSLYADICH